MYVKSALFWGLSHKAQNHWTLRNIPEDCRPEQVSLYYEMYALCSTLSHYYLLLFLLSNYSTYVFLNILLCFFFVLYFCCLILCILFFFLFLCITVFTSVIHAIA